MGLWADFWFYIRKLVDFDATQRLLTVVSILGLVAGIIFARPWALAIFLGVLMFSSFRLWRDDRDVQEREDKLFRELATSLREQVHAQESDDLRFFSFGDDNDDHAHFEHVFRKHFHSIATTIDSWCAGPSAQVLIRSQTMARVLTDMPDNVQEDLRTTVANSIVNQLGASRWSNLAPVGRFEVTPDANRFLAIHEGNGQFTIFNAAWPINDVDQVVADLNAFTLAMWDTTECRTWRELTRLDGTLREQLSEDLTKVINSNRLGRKHCDRECYEFPF
jgi:hypothetical protein